MRRFSKITFHEHNQTVDIGSGLLWDEVYKALEPYNVSVIGGRVVGVGVGGLLLGGGYGWKSNEYGLAIDNIFEYEVRSSYSFAYSLSNYGTIIALSKSNCENFQLLQ
jgi:FAD/FMN-containing dehydrogenase